jgi:hypothetical protein
MGRFLLALFGLAVVANAYAEPPPAPTPPAPRPVSLLPCEAPLGPDPTSESDACCDCPRAWVRVEALLGWGQGTRTPPLVTGAGNPPSVLFGGSRLNDGFRAGTRTEFGVWLDDCSLALQGGYFFLSPSQSGGQFGSASADRTVGRPFVNANTGQLAFEQVTTPGTLPGFVTVSSATTGIMGADALVRMNLCCQSGCDCGYRVDLLAGYRYFALNDQLTIRENLSPTSAPFVPGTQITLIDSFRTENNFHGGSIGAAFVGQRGPWTAGLTGRLDLGAMNREVTIFGVTRTDVPGLPPVLRAGGLLAQSSNSGTFRSSSFTLIPEFDLRLGCRVTERVSVTAGYWFLLLTDVARAGDQIDTVVNPNLVPGAPNPGVGPARPAFVMRQTNTWLQGLSLGLTASW